ncbi:MAG: DNA repair protein RecO [Ruminococcus sp.]|nr:DNA repair protein RecO [Ruminococcus sp.]
MTIVEGIVLKERSVGEQDKFIDILTRESGVIEVSVKGARKINGKSGSSTQLLAYSRFCVDRRGNYLYLNSAEPIHIFYGLRGSLTKVSLASYFAEVMRFCIKPEAQNGDIMRLLLNCLHFLENGERGESMIKSLFELRLMSDIGYMPDVVACKGCGVYEPEELFFCIGDGGFYCSDCFANDGGSDYMKVKLPVLSAVRHIVLSDFDRLFNFRVSEETQQRLSALTEFYLLTHLERSFGTLDFYKTIM